MDTKPLSLSACLSGHHDTELNILLCEWRGWYVDDVESDVCWTRKDLTYYIPVSDLPSHISGIEALGNCWEAEEQLTERQIECYEVMLALLYKGKSFPFHASPRHRVIAILQTVKPEMFE